jgi:SAM-dependent methyltransferase
MTDATDATWKRRLLRRIPMLSRLAGSLDALEAENRHLQQWADNLWDENRRLKQENQQLHELIGDHSAENQRLHRLLATLSQPALMGDDAVQRSSPSGEDGWPLPPPLMRYWVSGTDDPEWFLEGGRLGARTITETLARHGIAFETFDSILDFGCGCGRVLRALNTFRSVRLHGSDCNAAAIAWCNENLGFAQFGTNLLAPPTRYRPHSFDFIYAFSVFSHFSEPLQVPWIEELTRILKPGGLLLISVHGDYYIDRLGEPELARYRSGSLAVIESGKAGSNDCAAFHPQSYVRRVLARGFDVVDFVSEGALGNPRQDVYLLRSREDGFSGPN